MSFAANAPAAETAGCENATTFAAEVPLASVTDAAAPAPLEVTFPARVKLAASFVSTRLIVPSTTLPVST